MKKLITCLLAAVMLLCSLPSNVLAAGPDVDADSSIRIVATIFPEYDWVMNILGDDPAGAEVTLLLDNGVDLHSYQPAMDDILKIASCDLFIYVGGGSDEWVDKALQGSVNPDMIVINLLDTLGDAAKEEEVVEGMQENADLDEAEFDEHVWLSLRNASLLVDAISDAIQTIDPAHADIYAANTADYEAQLAALDAEYEAVIANASGNTLLFGDRFPFRYLTDDYGLSYYAAFAGCSAETEASFETITFLVDKANELGLDHVMTIDGTDPRIAETIAQNTETKDQKILSMNSMQSVTSADIQNGTSYLSIMEDNLNVLKEALE